MLVRPMLLHRMALVSVRLFCKNLGNLQEFFGQMVYGPPWQNIARTPMLQSAQSMYLTILMHGCGKPVVRTGLQVFTDDDLPTT